MEATLSRIRRVNPFLWLLGLSAILGNRQELAAWLEGVEYHSTWRSAPLAWRIARYRHAREKPDMLTKEVTKTIVSGGKSLVFVQSRHRAEDLSRHLQTSGLHAHYHHVGLSHEERKAIEQAFSNGELDVLVCTATLEMGLNLPARQVILYDIQRFDGIAFTPLSTNTVWQRDGRAGRPGLDRQGEVVLFAEARIILERSFMVKPSFMVPVGLFWCYHPNRMPSLLPAKWIDDLWEYGEIPDHLKFATDIRIDGSQGAFPPMHHVFRRLVWVPQIVALVVVATH